MNCKFRLMIALVCAASFVSAQDTVTLGVFGYSRVDKPAASLNIIGNSFQDLLLNELAPAESLNGDISALNADTIYIWNPTGTTYDVYAVYDERAYLGPSATVEWRDVNNFAGSAQNPLIHSGIAIWLSSTGSSLDTNLVVSGDIVVEESVTNQVSAGLQLLSYPFSMTVDLNDTMLADVAHGDISAINADKVYAWDSAG